MNSPAPGLARHVALLLTTLVACASPVSGPLPPPDDASPQDAASDGPVDASLPPDVAPVMDVAPTPDTAPVADAADAAGDAPARPTVAWGMNCDERSVCEGEAAYCALGFGRPVCLHECNAQAAWSSCEGGRGVCVPSGTRKVCVQRCGDFERTPCGPGTSCQYVAFRDNRAADGGVAAVGVCLADCAPAGADACMAAGRVCTPTGRFCADPTCPEGCQAGASCAGGECVPTPTIPRFGNCRTTTTGTNGCRDELCLGDNRGGYCTAFCNSDDESACGADSVCWGGNVQAVAPMGEALPDRLVSSTPARFNVLSGRARGVCLKPCADTGDCPTSFHCGTFDGRRVCMPYYFLPPTVAAGAGLPGSVCAEDGHCVTGRCVQGITNGRWGFCARASTAVPCPAGTAADATVPTACIPTCTGTSANECSGPLQCFVRAGVGQCLPAPCRENGDCRDGFGCNVQTGRCEAAPFRGGAAVGSPCTADGAACASGQCLTMSGTTALPGGYCTLTCVVYGDDSDSCPAGSICNASTAGVSAICLDLCDNAGVSRYGTCRTGYACQPFANDRRFGMCLPR